MISDHFYCCISGILFSTLVFGPACGFILGSVCTNYYVDALFIDTSEFQFVLCISKYNTNTQFRTTENCCKAFCFPPTWLLHLVNNWKHKASYSVSLSRSIISERINWKRKGQIIFHTSDAHSFLLMHYVVKSKWTSLCVLAVWSFKLHLFHQI